MKVRTRFAIPGMMTAVSLVACGPAVTSAFGQQAAAAAPATAGQPAQEAPNAAAARVQVQFRGGYETDPRDHGRPVVLIAAALGVPADVFREAFSHVTPAAAGQAPQPEQVQRNKQALLNALGRYGITNDYLDAVSNYYRYNRSRGEWWPYRPATAYVNVNNGTVTGFVVTDAGAGYSSTPQVIVPGHPEVQAKVTLKFTKNARANGSVAAIVLQPATSAGTR